MIAELLDGYLCIQSRQSFLLIGRVLSPFHLFIETTGDEYSQYLEVGDLVVVSAPEGGEIGHAMILLELIREYHAPLLVLPKGHPGSKRLTMVVSAGDIIEINCSIQRGTHPEQHLLCGSEDMAGVVLKRSDKAVEISGGDHLSVQSLDRMMITSLP
ncbi:MAG TPA: alpha/beta hydrolase [Methanospirillum sp.]|uniref:alpha/beta hydrolase n=1 Tax=Methanospirillum sp. TaxID=45200 RepID=UPI002BC12BCA|nr:alpha/beta hydrolase [Methanospirillum sp.]HOJ96304.1 alpha/beta hydrolase [Methanospirillum sp.]